MPTVEMPKMKQLIAESWEAFKASFGNVFLLGLVGSITSLIFVTFVFIAVVGFSFLGSLSGDIANKAMLAEQLQSKLTPTFFGQIGLGVMLFILISWIIGTVIGLSLIVATGKHREKPSFIYCLTQGFRFLIPTLAMGMFTSFITFGSSFLLIIPAIIIGLLFSFVNYELVLGGKKWFNAISGSVQVMSQHFGEVFLRMLAYSVGVYALFNLPIYLIQMLVQGLSEKAPAEAAAVMMILGIIRFLVSVFLAFFGISYSVVTYQHAKQATNETIKPKMTWIWFVTALGWLIAILIGMQLMKVYKSPMVQDRIKLITEGISSSTQVEKTEQQKLDAWRAAMSPELKGYYDKSQSYFDQMRASQEASPNSNTGVKKLNDQNIATLNKALELDDTNPEIWMNLASAYTWINSKGNTLSDALDASKKAEELDPSIVTYAKNTAEMLIMNEQYDEAILKLQQVLRADDNYGRAHILLGIAYKRTGLKEQAKTELQKGIDILTKYNEGGQFDEDILEAQKELQTVDQAVVKTTTTAPASTTASCISYPIREGEFASNKCYVKKDYDDLLYYLGRYNSAASTYNGAAASMNITCNGSDFFRAQCEEDKQTIASAQSQIDSYKATIRTIIAKGK